jgi:hypothetical protein
VSLEILDVEFLERERESERAREFSTFYFLFFSCEFAIICGENFFVLFYFNFFIKKMWVSGEFS